MGRTEAIEASIRSGGCLFRALAAPEYPWAQVLSSNPGKAFPFQRIFSGHLAPPRLGVGNRRNRNAEALRELSLSETVRGPVSLEGVIFHRATECSRGFYKLQEVAHGRSMLPTVAE